MSPFLNSIFKWQPKLHALLWSSQHLLLLSFQGGGSIHLTAHSSAHFVCKVCELCIANHAMMCVWTRHRWQTLLSKYNANTPERLTLCSFIKEECCLLSQQPNFHPTQTSMWLKWEGGGCCWWGWVTGSTEPSCSGASWSYLGYPHMIFGVQSRTKITATSERERGCSQFLP